MRGLLARVGDEGRWGRWGRGGGGRWRCRSVGEGERECRGRGLRGTTRHAEIVHRSGDKGATEVVVEAVWVCRGRRDSPGWTWRAARVPEETGSRRQAGHGGQGRPADGLADGRGARMEVAWLAESDEPCLGCQSGRSAEETGSGSVDGRRRPPIRSPGNGAELAQRVRPPPTSTEPIGSRHWSMRVRARISSHFATWVRWVRWCSSTSARRCPR